MKLQKILFLLFLLPVFLLSEVIPQTDEQSSDIQKSEPLTQNVDTAEKKLQEQIDLAKEIIKNINEEYYLSKNFTEINYESDLNYLNAKININSQENNHIAVKRDEIKVLYLQELRFFYNTLKEIVDAKKAFKEKRYFIDVINNNIDMLEKNSPDEFKTFYESEKEKENPVSKDLVSNYLEFLDQHSRQLFILKYLKENLTSFRTTNFLIDNFNLQYLVSVIDSYPYISQISDFSLYYLNFSVGDIVVVLFILLIFRLFIAKIIHYFIKFLIFMVDYGDKKKKIKREDEEEIGLETYFVDSIEKPLILILYTFSIQISIYILIKDAELLTKVIPWINTVYMGIFTWAIYSLLSNSISNYAQHLVEKYPNVRREMIVFIMRITKVVLILFVLLFLFTQLGIDIKAIAASLGVGGIAIALASKDTLANFFGSLNIMTDNSFSQGDWIVANEVEGTVVDIRMRTTRIRTFDNAMITVPNSEIANTHIKNYSKRRVGRRIKMNIGVTYESKMEDIVNLKNDLYEMLFNHPEIAIDNNAVSTKVSRRFEAIKKDDLYGIKRNLLVYIDEYGASSINILIYCFTKSPKWEDWLTTKEDVMVKISELVYKNNCEFAYPTQTLHIKK